MPPCRPRATLHNLMPTSCQPRADLVPNATSSTSCQPRADLIPMRTYLVPSANLVPTSCRPCANLMPTLQIMPTSCQWADLMLTLCYLVPIMPTLGRPRANLRDLMPTFADTHAKLGRLVCQPHAEWYLCQPHANLISQASCQSCNLINLMPTSGRPCATLDDLS